MLTCLLLLFASAVGVKRLRLQVHLHSNCIASFFLQIFPGIQLIKSEFFLRLCFSLYQCGRQTVGKRQGERQTVSNRAIGHTQKDVKQKQIERHMAGRQQEVNRHQRKQAARSQA
jgi:hypothetical protein